MMGAVDVRINQHQLRKATEMLSGVKGGIDRALLGAVQRSRRQAKTWASKQVRDRIRVKKKDVDQHLTTTRPTKAIRRFSHNAGEKKPRILSRCLV
jgi:hypothetical protein